MNLKNYYQNKIQSLKAIILLKCIPDGWKLVPVNPTRNMRISGVDSIRPFPVLQRDVEIVYKAMIEFAPKPNSNLVCECGFCTRSIWKLDNV